MKARYKLILIAIFLFLIGVYWSWIASISTGIIIFLWCLLRIGRSINDDCMTNDYYNQEQKPVESNKIPWDDLPL